MAKKSGKKTSKKVQDNRREPPPAVRKAFPFLDDILAIGLNERPIDKRYPVYVLGLYANVPDLDQLAVDALTDGPGDKDVDLCYIDPSRGEAFVVQAYVSEHWARQGIPENKADDLLTGFTWLLQEEHHVIPQPLRSRAIEFQAALSDGTLERIHLLFVHNGLHDKNIDTALKTVASSAKRMLDVRVAIASRQLGIDDAQTFFDAATKQIYVTNTITVQYDDCFEETGVGWRALSCTVKGDVLRALFIDHGDVLFSANIRGFLDQLGRKTSINRSIQSTVKSEPESFWVYNNGITVLTKRFQRKNGTVQLHGVSVINGAQTTGVLGQSSDTDASKVRVLCRFVECSDPEIVNKIIARNNTQNEVKPFDHRSNDQVQTALRQAFEKYEIRYIHRRTGAARGGQGAIQAETIAPYLAAFHGRFQTAQRERRQIFEDRGLYQRVFPGEIRGEHVYLVQCLADSISLKKIEYVELHQQDAATDLQAQVYELMRHSPSKFFIAALCGGLAPQILGRKIPDLFGWHAKAAVVAQERSRLTKAWAIALDAILPLAANAARDNAYEVVRSTTELTTVKHHVESVIESLRNQYNSAFSAIRDITEISP